MSDSEEWDAWLATLLNYDESNVREVMHIHSDGHHFPVLMHTAPIRGHNQTPIFTALTAVDITDQKQQNEALRRYANRLEAMHQIDQAILESRSPEQLAAAAIGNLQNLIHLDHACVIWLRDDDKKPELLAVYNHPSITNSELRSNIETICRELSFSNEKNGFNSQKTHHNSLSFSFGRTSQKSGASNISSRSRWRSIMNELDC